MLDATDFGKKLREVMVKNNLRQEQMAKALEVSPAILSNYITGKNIPDMGFLAKCREKYGMHDIDMAELFSQAFLGVAQRNQKIVIDTQYIDSKRLEILGEFLAVLVLFPKSGSIYGAGLSQTGKTPTMDDLRKKIDEYYALLKTNGEFYQHSE